MDFSNKDWFLKLKNEEYFSNEDYLPDLSPSFSEVKSELESVSEYLFTLLPDYSIGPEERIERLARIIPESILVSENMKTARTKLKNINSRLDELVPANLTSIEKIEYLVSLVNNHFPEESDMKFIEKLEAIDDFRRTDNGRRF